MTAKMWTPRWHWITQGETLAERRRRRRVVCRDQRQKLNRAWRVWRNRHRIARIQTILFWSIRVGATMTDRKRYCEAWPRRRRPRNCTAAQKRTWTAFRRGEFLSPDALAWACGVGAWELHRLVSAEVLSTDGTYRYRLPRGTTRGLLRCAAHAVRLLEAIG